MGEIVELSRALIVRLESCFCRDKQHSLFSVDWVLKQKHLMTKTERNGKVVSHYTNPAVYRPIVLQIVDYNLLSDLHPKEQHFTLFKFKIILLIPTTCCENCV